MYHHPPKIQTNAFLNHKGQVFFPNAVVVAKKDNAMVEELYGLRPEAVKNSHWFLINSPHRCCVNEEPCIASDANTVASRAYSYALDHP